MTNPDNGRTLRDGVARELLAVVYETQGNKAAAFTLRQVGGVGSKLAAEVDALAAALTPAGTGEKSLHAHFEKMQDMSRRYLEPIPYVDRDGKKYDEPAQNHQDYMKRELREKMTAAFAADMIYMLDGPEQRAAMTATPPREGVAGEALDIAFEAYQDTPIDLCADSDDDAKRCVANAIAAYLAATPTPAPPTAAGDLLHPWYGPCDALAPGNQCAECLKTAAGETMHPWYGPSYDESYSVYRTSPETKGEVTQLIRDYENLAAGRFIETTTDKEWCRRTATALRTLQAEVERLTKEERETDEWGCEVSEWGQKMEARATAAEAREKVLRGERKGEIVAAYDAGATAVHDYWAKTYPLDRYPDFTEAAHDYFAALSPKEPSDDRS